MINNLMWLNMIRYATMRYDAVQYNAIQRKTIQYNTVQYNTMQRWFIQHSDDIRSSCWYLFNILLHPRSQNLINEKWKIHHEYLFFLWSFRLWVHKNATVCHFPQNENVILPTLPYPVSTFHTCHGSGNGYYILIRLFRWEGYSCQPQEI